MSYIKTIGAFVLVNIRISQPSKVVFTSVLRLRNPDVNLKRMHQLYNVILSFLPYYHVESLAFLSNCHVIVLKHCVILSICLVIVSKHHAILSICNVIVSKHYAILSICNVTVSR